MWLIIFWNLLALILGLLFGISLYKKKKKENGELKGKIWGVGVFVIIMIFFNGVIFYTDFIDERRENSAFKDMEESYKENGVPNQESYKNLKLSIKTYKLSQKRKYAVYVANFNDRVSFNGKVTIVVKDDNDKVGEITTKQITLKPGEKMMIDSYNGPNYYDEYSWKWIGALK